MFSNFDEESRKILLKSKKEMNELNHKYIGTEHFILALLKDKKNQIAIMLNNEGITYENFRKSLVKLIGIGKEKSQWYLYTPLFKRVIEDAILFSRENNDDEVTLEYLVTSLFEEGEGLGLRLLLSMGLDMKTIADKFIIKKEKMTNKNKKKLVINDFGYNMNEKANCNAFDPVIGRNKEIEQIIEVLCRRTKNNPLLIGEAGVGKTAIIEEISRRIEEKTVPEKIQNKKIISISVASLISGTKYRGEFEERINKILKELEENENIILFIDEIHTLVGAGGSEGAIDASNILKPFLARGKIKVIGATTTAEYKKYLEDDRALDRRFQKIVIEEPEENVVIDILKKLKPLYESYHNVVISDDMLEKIVKLSNKYIYNRKQPDKSIDILDEVCSKVSIIRTKKMEQLDKLKQELKIVRNEKNKMVIKQDYVNASQLKEKEIQLESKINSIEFSNKGKKPVRKVCESDIATTIKNKTGIPIYEINNNNLDELKEIKTKLSRSVIGQEEAICILARDIKRIKLGYKIDNKPKSYLFVGKTGVGKTKLAKELSKIIGTKNNLIRLDMSEYKEPHSISKIIGSPPGYVGFSNKTSILDEVKTKPNAIILLDEIEKAHNDVINLFLQVLDEGKIKTSNNEEIRFDNNIIIMTSNIGSDKTSIGFNQTKKEIIKEELKNALSKELVNRIDEVIIFNQLTYENIKEIVKQKLNKMKCNSCLNKMKISFKNNVIEEIIKECNYKEYGARKIDKIINTKLYDVIIEEIINQNDNITIETI